MPGFSHPAAGQCACRCGDRSGPPGRARRRQDPASLSPAQDAARTRARARRRRGCAARALVAAALGGPPPPATAGPAHAIVSLPVASLLEEVGRRARGLLLADRAGPLGRAQRGGGVAVLAARWSCGASGWARSACCSRSPRRRRRRLRLGCGALAPGSISARSSDRAVGSGALVRQRHHPPARGAAARRVGAEPEPAPARPSFTRSTRSWCASAAAAARRGAVTPSLRSWWSSDRSRPDRGAGRRGAPAPPAAVFAALGGGDARALIAISRWSAVEAVCRPTATAAPCAPGHRGMGGEGVTTVSRETVRRLCLDARTDARGTPRSHYLATTPAGARSRPTARGRCQRRSDASRSMAPEEASVAVTWSDPMIASRARRAAPSSLPGSLLQPPSAVESTTEMPAGRVGAASRNVPQLSAILWVALAWLLLLARVRAGVRNGDGPIPRWTAAAAAAALAILGGAAALALAVVRRGAAAPPSRRRRGRLALAGPRAPLPSLVQVALPADPEAIAVGYGPEAPLRLRPQPPRPRRGAPRLEPDRVGGARPRPGRDRAAAARATATRVLAVALPGAALDVRALARRARGRARLPPRCAAPAASPLLASSARRRRAISRPARSRWPFPGRWSRSRAAAPARSSPSPSRARPARQSLCARCRWSGAATASSRITWRSGRARSSRSARRPTPRPASSCGRCPPRPAPRGCSSRPPIRSRRARNGARRWASPTA